MIVGLAALAVSYFTRRERVAALILGGSGAGLVFSGAVQAGRPWLALALLACSAALSIAALRATGTLRALLHVCGAFAAAAAWLTIVSAPQWQVQAAADLTALGGGAIAVAGATLMSWRRVDRAWAGAWAGVAGALVGLSAFAAAAATDAGPSGPITAGLALVTGSCLVASAGVRLPILADISVGWALAAIVVGLQWRATGPATAALVLSGMSAACAVAQLLPVSGRISATRTRWLRPLVEFGVVTAVAGIVAASLHRDPGGPLVPALAAAALQAASAGSVLRLLWLQLLAPVLACAAWLTFAQQAGLGHPPWQAMAVGLTVLVVEAMWRHDRAGRGLSVSAPEVVGVELVGIGLLVGPALVQTVVVSVGFSLLALLLGLAISGWGLATRVRRRLAAGAAVVLAAVVLLVAVPLVSLLPTWGGAALWILIAGVGIVAVLVASLLEEGRAAVRTGAARFAASTAGWE